jgi:argininosuccinate lyase
LRLLAGLLRTAEVDRERLARRAGGDFLTVTELADTLVRRTGMSFRDAHGMVARAVQSCADTGEMPDALLTQNPEFPLTRDEIESALDPSHFIRIRRAAGGPAPEVVAEALERARTEQRELERWIGSTRSG